MFFSSGFRALKWGSQPVDLSIAGGVCVPCLEKERPSASVYGFLKKRECFTTLKYGTKRLSTGRGKASQGLQMLGEVLKRMRSLAGIFIFKRKKRW